MESPNRKRVLLISSSIILMCMTVIVGMTWALFTDTVTVKNHLQAGDLNITLIRTNLETYSIDPETGYLTTTVNEDDVDFSNPTDKNVFDLTVDSKIVPCSFYTATMEISNNKSTSDVAYDYWIEIKLNVAGFTEEQIEALRLDEQLMITVESEKLTEPQSKLLSEGLTVGSSTAPIGTLTLGDSDEFTVKMEFVDSAANNAAKTQKLTFDLIVHAVQKINAPEKGE